MWEFADSYIAATLNPFHDGAIAISNAAVSASGGAKST
jgi:hypothetical protein